MNSLEARMPGQMRTRAEETHDPWRELDEITEEYVEGDLITRLHYEAVLER